PIFRCAIVCLLGVIILMLGGLGFILWNGQPGHEGKMGGGKNEMGGGEEQSEGKLDSKADEGTPGPKAGGLGAGKKDKSDSKTAETGKEKVDSGAGDGAKSYQVDVKASRVYIKVGSATRLGHLHGVEGKLKSGKI